MQKILAMLAFVLVCIAAASVAYYFGRYLPRVHDAELAEQRRKTDLENARRCNVDGWKYYSDYRKGMSPSSGEPHPTGYYQDPKLPGRWWPDPEMHFSKKLNTCLVEIGFNDSIEGGTSPFRVVIDVYGNREIISVAYTLVDGVEKPISNLPHSGAINGSKEYLAAKEKLFSE